MRSRRRVMPRCLRSASQRQHTRRCTTLTRRGTSSCAVVLLSTLLARAAAVAVHIQPWGADSFRIRIAPGSSIPDQALTALLPKPVAAAAVGGSGGVMINGNLRVEPAGAGGRQFVRVSDGKLLLTETK